MAQADKTASAQSNAAETPASEAVPPKRRGKLLLIIVLIVVFIFILVVGGFVALLLMKKDSGRNAAHEPVAESAVPAPAPVGMIDLSKPPVFVQLDPFTVNLRTGEDEDRHYLQTEISLRVSDPKTADALKGWMPEIRNRINLILTSKSVSDTQNDNGHAILQDEIMKGLNALFGVPPPPPDAPRVQTLAGPVQGVLFISFIVQ